MVEDGIATDAWSSLYASETFYHSVMSGEESSTFQLRMTANAVSKAMAETDANIFLFP